jgi:Pectate lyase superfamily protein
MLCATRSFLARSLRWSVPLGILVALLVNGSGGPAPARASGTPVVPATATWPAGDVPSLLTYELDQFADLSGKTTEVKAFGATGDGATDDTAAVQAAIHAANGGTLHFPAGVFVVDSVTVSGGGRVRLLGDGQAVTTLKHKAGSTSSMIYGASAVIAQFQAEHMSLDGNMSQMGAHDLSNIDIYADRALIQNIESYHTIDQSIRLGTTMHTSVVRNSYFHDFQLHGAVLNTDTRVIDVEHDIASDGDVWLVGNRVEMTNPPSGGGNSVGGFHSSGVLNTRLFIWNNTFRNMGQDWPQEYQAPIDIYRNGDGSVIWQNNVYSSYYTPIRVMRSNNVQIVDNIIDGEGQIGADWGGGIDSQGRSPDVNMHGLVVRGNSLRNLPDAQAITGFWDPGGTMSDITIDANTVDRTGGLVFLSYASSQVRVTNNMATNQSGAFVATANSQNVTLTQCGNSWQSTTCSGGSGTGAQTPLPTTTNTPTPMPTLVSTNTATPPPGAGSTPTLTLTPPAGNDALVVGLAEGGTDVGAWSLPAPYKFALNWNGSTGARPVAIVYAPVVVGGTVTGPTIINAGSQSLSGGSLLLLRGTGLSYRGSSPAVYEHGLSGGSTIAFATPVGTRPGDLVVVYIDTADTIVPPLGWTQERHDGEGTVWVQTFASVPTNLGSWSTRDDRGWTHAEVAFGGDPRVDASGGGGAQHNSFVFTGTATSP